MEQRREEAAPTFGTWKQRLEDTPAAQLPEEVERFVNIMHVLGTPMIDEPAVHFLYYDRDAQDVKVIGEFNQWKRDGLPLTRLRDTGLFYLTREFHGPLRVEYKFIVDGQWVIDPLCPQKIDNGIGEENSCFVVGDYRQPPELEVNDAIPHGRVQEFDFASPTLHNHRRVYIYLPAGYDTVPGKLFPSLYVHDGGEYLTRARLTTVLDNLIHAGTIVPLIAVMVDPVTRMREYWTNNEYAHFLEEELIPHIESRYRVQHEREARGVMGASLGGLISFYLALSRPHLFSKVAGQSSALFLEEAQLTQLVADLEVPLRVYWDVGTYEPRFIPALHKFVRLLEAQGSHCLFHELPAGHNWTSWRAHLKDLLRYLWGRE
jgi:enterochelin esterase family protein